MLEADLADAPYDIDVLTASATLNEKSTRADLRAFEIALARHRESSRLAKLAAVLSAGPLDPNQAADHVGVFARGLDEIRRFLEAGLQ